MSVWFDFLTLERWQSLAECAALEMRFTLRVTGVRIPLSPRQFRSRKPLIIVGGLHFTEG